MLIIAPNGPGSIKDSSSFLGSPWTMSIGVVSRGSPSIRGHRNVPTMPRYSVVI